MPCTIKNQSTGTVCLRLKDGRSLHLAAGATTPELEDAQVRANRRLAPLVERGLILVEDVAPKKGKSTAQGSPAKTPAPAKKT